jgi:hypothetical protein
MPELLTFLAVSGKYLDCDPFDRLEVAASVISSSFFGVGLGRMGL